MKKKNLLIILSFMSISLLAGNVCTKEINKVDLIIVDSTFEQIIELKNGSIYHGHIVQVMTDSIQFETNEVQFFIDIKNLKSILTKPISDKIAGKYWFRDKNQSRLFFAPTGKTLPKGEGYFIDYYIFFAGFAYGLTDRITIGGGVSLFPGVSIDDQLYYFVPKVGIVSTQKYSLSLSGFIFAYPDEGEEVGILYAMNTFDFDRTNITIGVGYGYRDGEISDDGSFILGINYRVSEKLGFISENWILPGDDNVIGSYGVRILRKSIAVDLGFFTRLDNEFIFPGVPYLDFVYNF